MPIHTREALEAEGAHLSHDQQPPANARIPSPSGRISILTWLLRKPPLSAVWTATRTPRTGIEDPCLDPRSPDSPGAKQAGLISTWTWAEANPTDCIRITARSTTSQIIKAPRTASMEDLTKGWREWCTGMTNISTTRSSRVILWARSLANITMWGDGTMEFRMAEIKWRGEVKDWNGISFNLEGIGMEILGRPTPPRQELNTIRITRRRISMRWEWCTVLEEVVWRLLIVAGRNEIGYITFSAQWNESLPMKTFNILEIYFVIRPILQIIS